MALHLFRIDEFLQSLARVGFAIGVARRRDEVCLRDLEALHRLDESERRNAQLAPRRVVISFIEVRNAAVIQTLIEVIARRRHCGGRE